jgi:glycerophosphoryl diester phosphodiesterase
MVYVVGHRGAPFYEPENTIESFKKAIELGADYIECDIHLTRDGEAVVIHDGNLSRMTNGRGNIKDCNLSDLARLTVGGKYKIPMLQEVINLDFPTIIELKCFGLIRKKVYPNLVKRVLEIMRGSATKEIIFVSFEKKYLEELNSYGNFKKMLLSIAFPGIATINKLNITGLGVRYNFLDERRVMEAHKNGLKILAWTVDKKEEVEKMAKIGVDFITSNDPKMAHETIKCIKKLQ